MVFDFSCARTADAERNDNSRDADQRRCPNSVTMGDFLISGPEPDTNPKSAGTSKRASTSVLMNPRARLTIRQAISQPAPVSARLASDVSAMVLRYHQRSSDHNGGGLPDHQWFIFRRAHTTDSNPHNAQVPSSTRRSRRLRHSCRSPASTCTPGR